MSVCRLDKPGAYVGSAGPGPFVAQGWAPEDWERWAADTLAAQLLPAH